MTDQDDTELLIAEFNVSTFGEKPKAAARLAALCSALAISSLAALQPARALLYLTAASTWAGLGVSIGAALKRWPWLADARRDEIVLHGSPDARRAFFKDIDTGLSKLQSWRKAKA